MLAESIAARGQRNVFSFTSYQRNLNRTRCQIKAQRHTMSGSHAALLVDGLVENYHSRRRLLQKILN